MRISILAGDRGYLDMKDRYYQVRISGKIVKNAVVADEEEGYVEVYKLDKKGQVVYNRSGPVLRRRNGRITIKWVGRER